MFRDRSTQTASPARDISRSVAAPVIELVDVSKVFPTIPPVNALMHVNLRIDAGGRRRALEALEQVDMTHRVAFLPTRLSGGERQRVAIARALMGNPDVLLCDEPTGNLDSHNTASMLDLLDALVARGITVMVITHEDAVAQRAHRRVRIVDGILTEDPFVRALQATP